MTIRLLLVDDHAVVRLGLKMLIESESDLEIAGEADSAKAALERAASLQPEVILMDVGLPDQSGIEVTREIKKLYPGIAVLALTIHEDEEYFFRMLDAGASGYVPKRAAPEELLTAIRLVASGEVYIYPSLAKLLVKDYLSQPHSGSDNINGMEAITAREQEVLAMIADGANNNEIAEALNISPKTVARHRENIMQKLNLHSRTELVRYAIRKGIIRP